MVFRQWHDPATGALSYLLADGDAGEAAVIDPRPADAMLIRALLDERGLRLAWVLRTHVHAASAAATGLAPAAEFGPPGNDLRMAPDGALLALGGDCLRVIATPGHTRDCLSYLWRGERLFCGDTLSFADCDQAPAIADPARLWESVTDRIFALAPETLLYAAHASAGRWVSSVAEQRLAHPVFARRTRDEFLACVASLAH